MNYGAVTARMETADFKLSYRQLSNAIRRGENPVIHGHHVECHLLADPSAHGAPSLERDEAVGQL